MNKVPLSTMIIVTGVTTLTIFLAWCTSTQTPPQDKETILSHQDQLDTWHTDQNELIQDTGVNALDIQELKMLYAKYESADDVVWQVAVMRHLYQIKPNPTIQYKLITKYLEIYRYDDAFDLLQDALKQDNVDHKIIDQYLFVLFNSRQLNISNITKISHLVEKFYQTDKIDNDQLNMYDALLDIVGLNIPSFQQHVSALSDSGNYQQFKQDISQMLQLHSSYKDASKYYLVALLSKVFFQHGYLKIADLLAHNALSHKSEYILPLQVLSYSSLLQNNDTQAIKSLATLITIDPKHQKLYKILLAIAYYQNKDYSNTIVHASQITEWSYYPLALRYLLLSYSHLWQDAKMLEVLQYLIWSQKLNDYDYYYVFDELFYKKNTRLYKLNPVLAAQYIDMCLTKIGTSDPICLYGQAGLYLARGESDKAHILLLKLSRFFPHAKIFVLIGQHYESQSEFRKAKSYYLKALTQSDSVIQKDEIKQMIDTLDI